MCIIDDLQDQILYIKISNYYLAFSNQTACVSKQQEELKQQTNENCTNLNCNWCPIVWKIECYDVFGGITIGQVPTHSKTHIHGYNGSKCLRKYPAELSPLSHWSFQCKGHAESFKTEDCNPKGEWHCPKPIKSSSTCKGMIKELKILFDHNCHGKDVAHICKYTEWRKRRQWTDEGECDLHRQKDGKDEASWGHQLAEYGVKILANEY